MEDWFKPEFDATGWPEGPGDLAAKALRVRMPPPLEECRHLAAADFNLGAEDLTRIKLRVFHDEETQIYLNGALATKLTGFINGAIWHFKEAAARVCGLATHHRRALSLQTRWGRGYRCGDFGGPIPGLQSPTKMGTRSREVL